MSKTANTVKVAVFCSGGGTNLQALLDAQREGNLGEGRIELVLSTSPSAYALERAKKQGIATVISAKKDFASAKERDAQMLDTLREHHIDIVVLAGYLGIVQEQVLNAYDNRIINIHPSLLPSFGGKGFYGLNVHQAALDYGVKITGATVHLVSKVVDGGEILLQKAVEVCPGDTPEILQKRVMEEAEWKILPEAVRQRCQTMGKLDRQTEER